MTLEESESALDPSSGFEPNIFGLGVQRSNHVHLSFFLRYILEDRELFFEKPSCFRVTQSLLEFTMLGFSFSSKYVFFFEIKV